MSSRNNWFRQAIRKNTPPIGERKAARYKRLLAIGYAVLAWHAFAIGCVYLYRRKMYPEDSKTDEEKKLTTGQYFAEKLQVKNPQIYRVDGFSVKKIEPLEGQKVESDQATLN
ncbi:uncharacterized protein LOC115888000 [Sitophilus oryzae]|uniref:Uncharacterized protein LOC115888000 n=1 Tax=Sitophilus oryzae TaxID=7048 RepID=A0A6J2YKP4_SITOR|nr:uncharacterized protein LOC115888000 [Sitophilus oryzae]